MKISRAAATVAADDGCIAAQRLRLEAAAALDDAAALDGLLDEAPRKRRRV